MTERHIGLSSREAQALLDRHGHNALPEQPRERLLFRFLRQFQNPLIYILLFALAVDTAVWIGEGAHGAPVSLLSSA